MPGKVYFITGANRGIGFHIVRNILSEGNTIIASVRNPDAISDLSKLASENANVHIVMLDISSQQSIDGLDAQLSKVAPDGIDVFISNAGICHPEVYGTVLKATTRDIWNTHYNTNTLGPIFVTQVVYPHLLKKQTRQLFYISSAMGSLTEFVTIPSSAYGQSKAALNYSIVGLSNELGPEGFTVVAVHPGVVLTDLIKNTSDDVRKNFTEDNTISPETSGEALSKLFEKITPADNGKFYNFDGTPNSF